MSTDTTTPDTDATLTDALRALDGAKPRSHYERKELAGRRAVVVWAIGEGDKLQPEARAEIARAAWAFAGSLSRGTA